MPQGQHTSIDNLIEGSFAVSQPSNNTRTNDPTENTVTALVFTAISKVLTYIGPPGKVRISFQLKVDNAAGTATATIYKNGTQLYVGTVLAKTYSTSSISYVTYTQDVYASPGDTFQIYAEVNVAPRIAYETNFTIGYDIISQAASQFLMNKVVVDQANGTGGTDWPIGTAALPVSNITDALTIMKERNLDAILLLDIPEGIGYSLPSDAIGISFEGDTKFNTDGLNLAGYAKHCKFKNMKIYDGVGNSQNDVDAEDCLFGNFQKGYLNCVRCVFQVNFGMLTIAPYSFYAFNCKFGIGNFDGMGSGLVYLDATYINSPWFINGSGEVTITNIPGASTQRIFIYGEGLNLTIDSSCVGGQVFIYGDCNVTNNSSTTIVNDSSIQAGQVLVGSTVKTGSVDLNQAAANYTLFTGTNQPVLLQSLIFKCPTGAAGGALTSISIQTDDATPQVIIPSSLGAVANLTSEAQIGWTAAGNSQPIYIGVGKHIQITIAGGATGTSYICTVVASYQPVFSGGSLA